MIHILFNYTATIEFYTLSLHDALPISERRLCQDVHLNLAYRWFCGLSLEDKVPDHSTFSKNRSEEHTSELQSRQYLVCRLLLEKKKKPQTLIYSTCQHSTLSFHAIN